MSHFIYKNNRLYCEDVDLSAIAQQYGTPCYVYSRAALESNANAYLAKQAASRYRVCYAVKANSNIAILNIFAQMNLGFDIVSIGELERVLAAKGNPQHVIFSGVGKRADEMLRAMRAGVGCFDVESEAELERLNHVAAQENSIVNVALRTNPNIDAGTHPYISTGLKENKFGIDLAEILRLCDKIRTLPHLRLVGLAFHIGSQLTQLAPLLAAMDCLLDLANQLLARGMPLKYLNVGGGLGVTYQEESPPSIADYLSALLSRVEGHPLEIILEPGRSLVANTGVLLTQVEYLKHTPHKNFAIVDAAMNDLIRPALYDAWHAIEPLQKRPQVPAVVYDVVGPVCETADFIGKHRALAIQEKDFLAVLMAGAYGFCMSSNYNSRPRAPEILVDKDKTYVIRKRESIADLFAFEQLAIEKRFTAS